MESRRKHSRFHCHGSADLNDGARARIWGEVNDISLGGFYVATYGPLPVATEVRFSMEVEGELICGAGNVATSHPGVGMGVAIAQLTSDYRRALEAVIRFLERSASPAPNYVRI